MPIPSAETSFRNGLVALSGGDPAGAAHHFQSAILIERQHAISQPQMRYLSYYGVALARSGRPHSAAIQACETAARREAYNPEIYLNLARVYVLAGKTSRALAALERALMIAPSHPLLLAELARHDRRAAPPLSFVPRKHPLNKLLGKIRAALTTHRAREAPRAVSTPSP
jgi:tetratricopeptide (TPR) repeat protein